MPIDTYSPCPGGTGKKIKFCCPDLVTDLQKIERMLQGDQHLACMEYVNRLDQQHPGRACLLATKALLLRAAGRMDEARTVVDSLLQKHPANPLGLAESAMLTAATEGGRAAMAPLQRMIETFGEEVYERHCEAIGIVARILAAEGQPLAAEMLLLLQMSINPKDRRPMEMLGQINISQAVPLVVKDSAALDECPSDVPWKTEFDEALSAAERGRWSAAAEKLLGLAQRVGDVPEIWRNVGILRGWLADTSGSVEALRKFASLDVPTDDAVEAEALAMFFSDDPLGDRLEVFDLTYPVGETEQLQLALAAAPLFMQAHIDPSVLADGDGPPPKGVYTLIDCPMPSGDVGLTIQTAPTVRAQALLFGRQTDRQARLVVVGVRANDLGRVKAMLGELADDGLDGDHQQELSGHVLATRELLDVGWALPEDTSREHLKELFANQRRDAILERWPNLPLGVLDGKSPQEAAGGEAYHVRLLAAVMLLEFWLEQSGAEFDFNQLRGQLGLPLPEPIDPDQTLLEGLPLVRLSRVITDKLTDEGLVSLFQRARTFNARVALRRFARAMIDRPSLAGKEEQFHAFSTMAGLEEDSDQALEHVQRGRQAAESAGESSASWDLLELSFRFERAEGEEAMRLIDHIRTQHMQEPNVAQALTHLLMRVGLIRPDGTLAVPPPGQQPGVAVGQSPAGAPEIWTPGSQEPAGEKPKIWTPGMD